MWSGRDRSEIFGILEIPLDVSSPPELETEKLTAKTMRNVENSFPAVRNTKTF